MSDIKLDNYSTRAPEHLDKGETKDELKQIVEELDELQNMLYAEGKHSVLLVLQGMDASGKDGLVKSVFDGLNPHGIHVQSFKVPTEKELSHDFLWRIHKATPAKGMIQIFNRSHYEDILVTRVHKIIDDATAKKRMKAINDFEQLLVEHNNTQIIKCYLHVSKEEQLERLNERLTLPRKMWKYNSRDFKEREKWDEYRRVYEEAFKNCNYVPWHIVPADQNWYKAYYVAKTLRDTLKGLNMKYPTIEQ